MLQGWSGHYYILNTAAIEKLGLKESEPDPLGGRFVRDSDGKLTGLTQEYATFRLHRRISELTTDQEALRRTRDFLSSAVRLGINSVQNMSAPIAPDRLVSLRVSTHSDSHADHALRADRRTSPHHRRGPRRRIKARSNLESLPT